MARKCTVFIIGLAILVSLSGCASISRSEQACLRELQSYGISETEVQKKHPAVAAGLNVLPGFGFFYLAVDSNESNLWLFGALSLVTWPVSVIWGVPEGVIDANTINKKETVYYYFIDRMGKQEFEKIKADAATKTAEKPAVGPVK